MESKVGENITALSNRVICSLMLLKIAGSYCAQSLQVLPHLG